MVRGIVHGKVNVIRISHFTIHAPHYSTRHSPPIRFVPIRNLLTNALANQLFTQTGVLIAITTQEGVVRADLGDKKHVNKAKL